MNKVTVNHSISIAAPVETVWDYTQDWRHRREWDGAVAAVEHIGDANGKFVRARFRGGMTFDIEYKLNDRPRKTSLAMKSDDPSWVVGGGGSWRYEEKNGRTEWVQVNTLVLSDALIMRALRPLLWLGLYLGTSYAMAKARRIIEQRH